MVWAVVADSVRVTGHIALRPGSDHHDYGMMTMVAKVSAMKTMPAGKFKTNCLAVMDEVKARREEVLITKHGEPVAKLVPVTAGQDDIFGFFAGRGAITGDVVAPVLSSEEWGNLK